MWKTVLLYINKCYIYASEDGSKGQMSEREFFFFFVKNKFVLKISKFIS